MYIDTTPVAGPSRRSYAQVVKHAPSRARTPTKTTMIASTPPDCDEDWTDVSSVTSCGWPGSVDEEQSLPDAEHCSSDRGQTQCKQPHPGPQEIDDVLWVDDAVDSRAPHAMAGNIKFRNRSYELYTNVRLMRWLPMEEEDVKKWRRYPGTRATPAHERRQMNREKAGVRRGVRKEARVGKKTRGID